MITGGCRVSKTLGFQSWQLVVVHSLLFNYRDARQVSGKCG